MTSEKHTQQPHSFGNSSCSTATASIAALSSAGEEPSPEAPASFFCFLAFGTLQGNVDEDPVDVVERDRMHVALLCPVPPHTLHGMEVDGGGVGKERHTKGGVWVPLTAVER